MFIFSYIQKTLILPTCLLTKYLTVCLSVYSSKNTWILKFKFCDDDLNYHPSAQMCFACMPFLYILLHILTFFSIIIFLKVQLDTSHLIDA